MAAAPDNIIYLTRSQIDTAKWDECIHSSANGLIYGNSWWLDNMCANWSALVLDDYDAAMPITWKKKYGIQYVYQPWFTANLGVFYKNDLKVKVGNFLKAIPREFKLWDFDLNENNAVSKSHLPNIQLIERKNMLVDLQQGYATVASQYSRMLRRKLRFANEQKLEVDRNFSINTAIDFYIREYKDQHPGIAEIDYTRLLACCSIAQAKGQLNCYAAMRNDELLAVYIVLKDSKYFYSLLGGSTEKGKEYAAFYKLTDSAIQDAAIGSCTFRFEGSDMEGIAFFNKQFGAVDKTYVHLKYNRLPFPVNLLKR